MKLNPQTLRNYLVVHTWVGILSSLFLFVAFYAGALAMFKPEINHWTRLEPVRVNAGQNADLLMATFLQAHPEAKSATLVLRHESNPAPYIDFKAAGRKQQLQLNENGTLQPVFTDDTASGRFVDYLHRKGGLPLPLDGAEPIIGVVSMLYALALVSGVVVLLPSLVKDLFVLRFGRNMKRWWLDLHNLLGVASLPFHVVMALSAAVFCLHDWIYDAQNVMIYPDGLKSAEQRAAQRRPPVDADTTIWLTPTQLTASAQRSAPGFTATALDYRDLGAPKAAIYIAGRDDGYFKRSPRVGYAVLEPMGGAMVQTGMLPGKGSTSSSILVSFFSLHFGSFGGEPVRVLYAVLGVMGSLLFYTGNVLWIESRTKRLRGGDLAAPVPRHVRWVSSLNLGVSLGCVTGLSAALVAARWLSASPWLPDTVLHASYYVCFVACLVYAFARGTQKATVGLLACAAFATALIPFTSLWLALAQWPTALFKPAAPGLWFVDVLSAGAAILLAWLCLRTRRRNQVLGMPPSKALAPAAPLLQFSTQPSSHHD